MLRTAVLPSNSGRSRSPLPHARNLQSKASSDSGWECTECTVWNDTDNLNCTMCLSKKPGQRISLREEQEKMPQMGMVRPRFSLRFKALFSKAPPEWECPRCTYINGGYFTQCQACRFLRLVEKPSGDHGSSVDKEVRVANRKKSVSEEPASSTPSVFESVKAFFRRSSDSTHSKGGVAVKVTKTKEETEKNGKVGEKKWECQQCTLHNSDSLNKCSVCDMPRNFDFDKRTSSSSRDSLLAVEPDSASQSTTTSLRQSGEDEFHGRPNITDPHTKHTTDPQQNEIGNRDVPTAHPALPISPGRQLEQPNLVSSQGAPTWRCEVCGAYNVVMEGLRQCYICGIGVIPECYLSVSRSRDAHSISSPQAANLPSSYNHKHPCQSQKQRDFSSPQESARNSTEQEYVNPHALQNHEHLLHVTNHRQSPPIHQPLTHINHFQVPSPHHCTGSNDRVVPQMEQQRPTYINSHCTVGREGHLHPNHMSNSWGSPLDESCIDPYSRPRTPTDVSNSRMERHAHQAQHHKQHSDEGTKTRWMEASIHCNRTKCLKETRHKDVLYANSLYQRIQQYCRESGEPFTDPDFPPADKSLYINPRQPVSRWRVGKWERPVGVRDSFDSHGIEWTVVRNARPEDIAQGVLGNCWVLSALGVIAEQPQLIEDILITKKYSPRVGAYQVRLCRDGQWEVVVIDDCFPCLTTGELVFSKAHRKQLWVPLIEKALAKLYGSYEALNAGRVLLGLSVLTGLPCEKIHLKKPSLKEDAIDTDLVWAKLLSFRERGFPMSASCGGHGEEESVFAMMGLESNHAYSILDVRQLGSERLVRLRNPWGKYSWKGSWSDRDARWDSHPRLREELQAVGGEAGVFWIGAQDFFQYFCEVDVCKYRPNWHSLRSEGKFLPYAARQIKTLAFEVKTTTEVDISIYQPSSRGRSNRHNLVDMAVLVLSYPTTKDPYPSSHPSPLPTACSLESGCHIQSLVTTDGFLPPGRYVILPLAFNHYRHITAKGSHRDRNGVQERGRSNSLHQQQSGEGAIPYVVAVFSAQELAYESVTTRPGFLPESLMLLAEKIGKATQPFPGMFLYEVYMKHSCRYVVAVNLDNQLHFSVTCDGLDSANVLCSRGEMYTQDCIPPRHRQVLWVLTQLESSSRYSVLMRISTSCTQLNSQGQWGAQHTPPLNSTTTELHAPRLIS